MEKSEIEKYVKAGQICREVREYAKQLIKPEMLLLDIAEKIEKKIIELGGKPAFPVSLAINEIAAHDTPLLDDDRKAEGLLKIDFGISVDGCIVDTAFSLDLENSEENKKMIEASEKALGEAIKIIRKNIQVREIGKAIYEKISNYGFSPIRNLSGHKLGKYKVHAGLTIPNYDNNNITKLDEGIYAIEPFATSGQGVVYDGKHSSIYRLEEKKAIRDSLAREILNFIIEEYKGLPFCERWIVKKFGKRAEFSLNLLEKAKILHHYPMLIEKGKGRVSQAENTVLISDKVEVLS